MFPLLAEILKQPSKLDCLKLPKVLELENLIYTPFHLISLALFILAIIHTLSAHKIHSLAQRLEMRQGIRQKEKKHRRSFLIYLLYFLAEVEVVFAIWAIPLFFVMSFFYNWTVALDYVNTRDYTEALFVVVILCISSTRPIVQTAEASIAWIAKKLGGSLSAWWLTLLTIGPLMGSLITETGAMALCAFLLSRQFYEYRPSLKLSYATLGLLFVNISVGGILTNFASPAVLILAHHWGWSTPDMFLHFGWKAALGICLSNLLYWFYFRKEFQELDMQRNPNYPGFTPPLPKEADPIPAWITCIHLLFLVWVVLVSHYPAIFIASLIFFIGFHQATCKHQSPIHLTRPLLVGLFLAGIIVHGGLQGWWVVQLLEGLDPLSVMGVAIAITGFNDNTSIAYLATLMPNWGEIFEYAVFTGIIAGGGLTVIGNAPNPAGQSILKKHFGNEIKPTKLFLGAFLPTLVLYAIFYFFGPLYG